MSHAEDDLFAMVARHSEQQQLQLENLMKTAAIDASQLQPPQPGAEAAAAAAPPMADPSMMAAAAPAGAAPAAGAPPAGAAPAGDPAAAAAGAPPADPAAAAGAPPADPSMMDPSMAGPPPTVEEMAQQGDPIATFLMQMHADVLKTQQMLKALLQAMNAQVPAAQAFDGGSEPKLTLAQPAGAESGAKPEAKKTAGVVGRPVTQLGPATSAEDFDDTDLDMIDNTDDDSPNDQDQDLLARNGLVLQPKAAAQPAVDPRLPKAAAAPAPEVAMGIGARAGKPGDNGAVRQPSGLTSMPSRSASHVRMLRLRNSSERDITSGRFAQPRTGRMRP